MALRAGLHHGDGAAERARGTYPAGGARRLGRARGRRPPGPGAVLARLPALASQGPGGGCGRERTAPPRHASRPAPRRPSPGGGRGRARAPRAVLVPRSARASPPGEVLPCAPVSSSESVHPGKVLPCAPLSPWSPGPSEPRWARALRLSRPRGILNALSPPGCSVPLEVPMLPAGSPGLSVPRLQSRPPSARQLRPVRT